MFLKHAEIDNFRCLNNLKIKFDKNLTVITGANGSGKTAIIDALTLSIQKILEKIYSKKNFYTYSSFQKYSCCKCRNIYTSLFFLNSESRLAGFDLIFDHKNFVIIDFNNDAVWDPLFAQGEVPVLVRYTANRFLETVPAQDLHSRNINFSVYYNAFEDQIDFASTLCWFIKKSEEESRSRSILEAPAFTLPELSTVRKAVTRVLKDYEAPFVDKVPPQIFIRARKHPEITLSLEQLSGSTRTMLALVMDLARRMAVANEFAARRDGKMVLDYPGIVLIDEIELHLHPAWQQTILPTLQSVFPNVQFIVTTQSPLVLSSVEDKHIRILERGTVHSAPRGTLSADASRILKRVLGVDTRPPSLATDQLKKYAELVYADKWDSEEAKELRAILDARYGNEEPELIDLDIYISNRKWDQEEEAKEELKAIEDTSTRYLIVNPCPICGATPKYITCDADHAYYVQCPECGYRHSRQDKPVKFSRPEDALGNWNLETMKQESLSKAKPCPLCGSEKLEMDKIYSSCWAIRCTICDCQSGAQKTMGSAVRAWNRRSGGALI